MRRSVLVVEEHPALRRAYVRLLRDAGYEVFSASPAEEIEPLLAGRRPDAIILDPAGAAGKGMLIAESALKANPSIALVFNASDSRSIGTDFSTWVADAYTVRTSAPEELLHAVQALLPPGRGGRGAPARPGGRVIRRQVSSLA